MRIKLLLVLCFIVSTIALGCSNGSTFEPTPTSTPNPSVEWFGTSGSGVSKYDGTNWTTYNTSNSGLANDVVWGITIDSAGNKWFGTWGGISEYDGTYWTTYNTSNSGLAGDYGPAMAIDSAGNKWFGTDEIGDRAYGVSEYDGNRWITYNTSNSGLAYNYVSAIAIEDSGGK